MMVEADPPNLISRLEQPDPRAIPVRPDSKVRPVSKDLLDPRDQQVLQVLLVRSDPPVQPERQGLLVRWDQWALLAHKVRRAHKARKVCKVLPDLPDRTRGSETTQTTHSSELVEPASWARFC
jgi:hypothetical protein